MNMPYSQFTGENANLNYGLAALMAYYFTTWTARAMPGASRIT